MKELITENERSFQQLEDTLKDEYTIRANIAADYITQGWEDYKEADDFAALAKLLGVDEVHVFDEKVKSSTDLFQNIMALQWIPGNR